MRNFVGTQWRTFFGTTMTVVLVGWATQVGALTVTVKKAIEAHTIQEFYWKSFINYSYFDVERKVIHTERKETGR